MKEEGDECMFLGVSEGLLVLCAFMYKDSECRASALLNAVSSSRTGLWGCQCVGSLCSASFSAEMNPPPLRATEIS